MNWVLFATGFAALLGVGYGAFRLVTWQGLAGLLVVIVKALMPAIFKRMSPEDEAALHQWVREGHSASSFRRKPVNRRVKP